MRAAEFTSDGVQLGGYDAPQSVETRPTALSPLSLWGAVAAIIVFSLFCAVALPGLITNFEPNDLRVTAGGATFIPADGWQRMANPPQAPSAAVTYGKNGATFTVWTQPGADPEALAKRVTSAFYLAAGASGNYLVQHQNGGVLIRPLQSTAHEQISQVSVTPIGTGSSQTQPSASTGSHQMVVTVWAGPPPALDSHFPNLWSDVTNMQSTLEARGES